MRHFSLQLLATATSAFLLLSTHAQQTLIDLPLEYANSFGAVQRPDGGTIAAAHLADLGNTTSVIALDAQGILDWSRTLTPEEGVDIWDVWSISNILSGPNGGVILTGYASPVSINADNHDVDTTYVRHPFTVMTDEGEISDMWMVSREVIAGVGMMGPPDLQQVAAIPSGGCYLILDYASLQNSLELVRLSATGELQWARSIGTPSGPEATFPTEADFQMSFNLYTMRVLSSSTGDAYLINLVSDPWQCLNVKKITAEGSLMWSKDYCFNNAPEGGTLHDAVIGGDGNIHVLARYGPQGSDVHLALEIDQEGTLTSADALDIPSYGDYFILGEQDGHRWLVPLYAERIMHLSPDGAIETTVYPPELEEPYTLSTEILAAGSTDGTVRMTSRLAKQHNDFMTIVRYPVIWHMPGDNLDVCGSYSFTSEYQAVPLENFEVTDALGEVAVDVTDKVSSSPVVLYTAADPSLSAFNPCEFSVGQEHTSAPTHTVRPNLLSPGETIALWTVASGNIQLFSMDGRLVLNEPVTSGSFSLPITCLPGAYMLRATNAQGDLLWFEKLTVQ